VCASERTRAWQTPRLLSMEASIVWLAAIALALSVLGIRRFFPRQGRPAHQADLGWMSQQWLAEHRAGSR